MTGEIPEILKDLFLTFASKKVNGKKKTKQNHSSTSATSAELIPMIWGFLESSRQFPDIINRANQDKRWEIEQ